LAAPFLIALGGPPGSGKSTLSARLAREWSLPRLELDLLGRTIRSSEPLRDTQVDTWWVAYDVLFALAEEWLASGVSGLLDLNLGWTFQWAALDAIAERHPEATILPVVLRCPREVSLARIQARHLADPTRYSPPSRFTSDPRILAVWDLLENLDRPDVEFIDSSVPLDGVFAEMTARIRARLPQLRNETASELGVSSFHDLVIPSPSQPP
jgi:predicted kinase